MSNFYMENIDGVNFRVSWVAPIEDNGKNSFSKAPNERELYVGSGRVIGKLNPELDRVKLNL